MNQNLKILQISALEKSRVIQERCNALTHRLHQSEVSKDFLDTINVFCKYLDSCIKNKISLRSKIIQQMITLLQKLGEELKYIESGIMHKVPWSYISPFEKSIEKVCGKEKFHVLICARWNYNYTCRTQNYYELYLSRLESISGLGNRDIENDLRILINKLKPDLKIIEFPYLERMNILFHVLIGHEIGHIFTGEFIKENQKEIQRNITKNVEEQLKNDNKSLDKIKKSNIIEAIWYKLTKIMEEILCDLFCAYIFGPATLFTIYEFAKQFELDSSSDNIVDTEYPPWRYRLRKVHELLTDKNIINNIKLFSKSHEDFKDIIFRLDEIQKEIQKQTDLEKINKSTYLKIVFNMIESLMDNVRVYLKNKVSDNNLNELSQFDNILGLFNRLKDKIPPNNFYHDNCYHEPPSLNEIINSSWFYMIAITQQIQDNESIMKEYKNQLKLTLKAIEMADIQKQFMSTPEVSNIYKIAKRSNPRKRRIKGIPGLVDLKIMANIKGVLVEDDIINLIEENKLIITPLLNPDGQIECSSVDIRLGTEFIIMQKRALPVFDSKDYKGYDRNIIRYQEKIRIGYRDYFTVHPNSLVLASCLEYISLPKNLMCYVVGKSSWGRLGLVIATATKVDPGYKGCITLEIVNLGAVPIKLYPGLPIAQLVFHYTASESKYEGSYSIATGPEFPKLDKNTPDWTFWYPENTEHD